MRIIDRLLKYLQYKRITPYAFERVNQVANGYLKKQLKGRGTVGSDILERIYKNYTDLDLIWLVAGEGQMLMPDRNPEHLVRDGRHHYSKDELIQFLTERIALLEIALADKEKIISLMETQIGRKEK